MPKNYLVDIRYSFINYLTNSSSYFRIQNKQYVKPILKPLGFNGYKLSELTPNLTRRAQCVNWLLYYREELFGYTLEELREKRRLKQQEQEQEQEKPNKNQ